MVRYCVALTKMIFSPVSVWLVLKNDQYSQKIPRSSKRTYYTSVNYSNLILIKQNKTNILEKVKNGKPM